MKVVDDRTTSKDNDKNQTTNIIYDQNSMFIKKLKQNQTRIRWKQKRKI